MKYILSFLLVFSPLLSASALAKAKDILVGAYGFAPYYDLEKGKGLTNQVLDILNSMQSDYHFAVVEITSKRRYQSFVDRKVDMIFFEDPRWGWQDIPHFAYETNLNDAEVYIAHKSKAMNQSYFDSLKNKSIAGILGYHYGFANFNADEVFLRSKFQIFLVSHNLASVRLVVHDRVNMAVVPRSYIKLYLQENPKSQKQILISDKVDQNYELKFLVNPKASIPKVTLDKLMKELLIHPRYLQLLGNINNN